MKKRPHGKGKVKAALLAAAAIMAGGAALGWAQQAAPPTAPAPSESAHPGDNPPAQGPTIRATVQLVNVPVTATTKRGQRVIDLTLDNLKVYEDGVEQKITHFERETRTPLCIGLIIDTSNSARPKLAYEKDAAQQFVDMILANASSKTKLFIETFDNESSLLQDFTNDPDLLSAKLDGMRAGGGKALYDAVYTACREKMMKSGQPEEMRRVLIVISDGLDVQSKHTLDEVVSISRVAETMIYTVGTAPWGFDNPGDKLLEEMATQTGGYPLFPLRNAPGSDDGSGFLSHNQIGGSSQNRGEGAETGRYSEERLANLAEALQGIGKELSEQYWISYRPTHDAMDGSYREIKVVCSRRGVVLRWKPGYFATAE